VRLNREGPVCIKGRGGGVIEAGAKKTISFLVEDQLISSDPRQVFFFFRQNEGLNEIKLS
jgi:hypothetical protein